MLNVLEVALRKFWPRMGIICKSRSEIEKMRRSGHAVRQILDMLRDMVAPGVSTLQLEQAAEKKIRELGATSAFKGQKNPQGKKRDYPCVLCTSVNDEIIHGIPSSRQVLKSGDVVSIDCGVLLDGYYGDAAITVPVGKLDEDAARLLQVTEASLYKGIEAARLGNRVGDVSHAVQKFVEANGYSVVREFVGHGIGTRLHEDPQVPNHGRAGYGAKLKEGMVLAIEPMVNAGAAEALMTEDEWTAVTADGSFSAHFEHCVAITSNGPDILTR